jgi:hypothetical protein
MVLAVVLFPLKLCDPNNMLKFFYSLHSLYSFGRLNCQLCKSACVRCTFSINGRCLVRISTGTWAVPVGLPSFCSVSIRQRAFPSESFSGSSFCDRCVVFGFLAIFLCFTWPISERTNVAKFWRSPKHPFLIGWAVECGNTALPCTGQEVRAWLPSDNWRLRRKLVIGCCISRRGLSFMRNGSEYKNGQLYAPAAEERSQLYSLDSRLKPIWTR